MILHENTLSFKSPLIIENGVSHLPSPHLSSWEEYSQIIILTDRHLLPLYAHPLANSLKKLKKPILTLTVPTGEKNKNLTQAKRCWEKMAKAGIDRKAAFIAVGGGVICDLAGFVASCYMRGLDTFLFPTTLLAMVDASIGGKTAVNLPQAKNVVGSFHFPKKVFIDPVCLSTLPPRELRSGLAEVIKYGMIADLSLVELLERNLHRSNQDFIIDVIRRCAAIKQAIVAEDEREMTGKRASLNYGHTFGHAIEAATEYSCLTHGEAIAMGMCCAAEISARLSLCSPSLVQRQEQLFKLAELPTQLPPLPIEDLMGRMKNDKKTTSGKITLILLKEIGEVVNTSTTDPALIEQVLKDKIREA